MKKYGERFYVFFNYVESFYLVLLKEKKKVYKYYICYYNMIIFVMFCSENII